MTKCRYCNREPHDLREFVSVPVGDPIMYAKRDRTYNSALDEFACFPCWKELGKPDLFSTRQWIAGDDLNEVELWRTIER